MFDNTVDQAVEVCIQEGILKTFLLRHRAEVKNVILEEFDLNKYLELEKKESYTEGLKEGEDLFAALTQKLIAASRLEDLTQAISDTEYRKVLYEEYNLK